MKAISMLMLTVFAVALEAHGQAAPATSPTAMLQLTEAGRSHAISLQVTVDDQPYDEYWATTFDAIFDFADSNSDGVLNDEEIRLVPSARAVRLSLGNGFAPPVASIQSLKEVVADESPTCSKEALRDYYRRHGAGRLQIGSGNLSNTTAITQALVQALDEDRNGRLSRGELAKAEMTLRRLDTNGDELIGVGELVPNATYPGHWATNGLPPSADIDLSPAGDRSFTLKRLPLEVASQPTAGPATTWQIKLSDRIHDEELKVGTQARCESWSIPGSLTGAYVRLCEDIASHPDAGPANEETGQRQRERRSRAWLTPLVDRDRNGEASQPEIDRWLGLQKQLIHGQLLISVYHGGGVFELLDTNHDAALSVRELRSAWEILKSAGCTTESDADPARVPSVVFFVVSQGYPDGLAKASASDVEWFRLMDRNADGDVSRQEFTSSPEAFNRLDRDRDGLISPSEAAAAN